jgi:light-regulated signal transduction histidine kinase (bacteriophytochrome)
MAAVSSQRSKLTKQAAAIERKSGELQLKSDELQRSNYDLEQFAYVASHDLKAPLRAIDVLVEWLKEDLEEFNEGEVQENLGLLVQRTSRLNRLLDDLLAYSRAGRKIGDVKKLNIQDFVDDIVTLIAPPEGFVIETEGDLPTIVTHHAPLETVFRNLISNAIKHSPVPEEGRIRIYAEDQGEKIMFAVEDNGTGIPEEYAEKVFKMFQTLKARDEMEGSGMGLAIVQRIIDWQGGRIWFHKGRDDKGVVFKFLWSKAPQVMPEVTPQDAPAVDEVATESAEAAPDMSDTQILMAG